MDQQDDIFQTALEYAYKVVHSINKNPVDQEDLIQDFCYKVLNNPDKYNPILHHKSTVYNILKGLNSNAIRKHKPVYTDRIEDYEVPESRDYDARSRDHIESILRQKINPNGRKGSLLPLHKQKAIVENYPRRTGSMRDFCKEYEISTATLHRLLKQGPKPIKTPLSITYFMSYHFDGMGIDQIATAHHVTPHSVSQNIHKAKKAITSYFEEQDLMNTNLERVYDPES